MIKRFSRINLNSFQNFSWEEQKRKEKKKDREFPDFARYNLIYGWNGSGKSTISEAFRSVPDRDPPGKDQFELETEAEKSTTIAKLKKNENNEVYVFNSHMVGNFIKKVNVKGDGEKSVSVAPHILGEKNIQTKEQITEKEESLKEAKNRLGSLEPAEKEKEDDFDDFCTKKASEIKSTLTDKLEISDPRYNKIRRPEYRTFMDDRIKDVRLEGSADVLKAKAIQAEKELIEIKSGGNAYNESIDEIVWKSTEALSNLEEKISQALELSPVNKAIDTLKENPEIEAWAKEGWRLHKKSLPGTSDGEQQVAGVGEEITCQFCDNIISTERLNALQQHFSDAYYNAVGEIQKVLDEVKEYIDQVDKLLMPHGTLSSDEKDINPEVREEWSRAAKSVKGTLVAYKEYLERAKKVLTEKEKNPAGTPTDQLLDRVSVSFNSINELVRKHNRAMVDSAQNKRDKTENWVNCMLDLRRLDYEDKKEQIRICGKSIQDVKKEIEELQQEIYRLKKDLFDDKEAIEHLNRLIKGCFNNTSLRFEPVKNGEEATYKLMRKNPEGEKLIEDNLSDGERSAIAFLYFLISLQDKDTSLENSIVIIDDPMSNMDYSVSVIIFGLIIEYAAKADQLFVLTHRYDIFSQLKRHFRQAFKKVEIDFYKNEREEQEKEEQKKEKGEEEKGEEEKEKEREKKEKKREGREKRKEEKKKKKSYSCYLLAREKTGSSFTKLPKMLLDYDSEYGYLFYEIRRAKNDENSLSSDEGAERLYYVANMCRKLVEHFVEFRAPHKHDFLASIDTVWKIVEQNSKVGEICLDTMYTSLQGLSHASTNFNGLTAAKPLCRDVMNFIKLADKEHYKNMKKTLGLTVATDEPDAPPDEGAPDPQKQGASASSNENAPAPEKPGESDSQKPGESALPNEGAPAPQNQDTLDF